MLSNNNLAGKSDSADSLFDIEPTLSPMSAKVAMEFVEKAMKHMKEFIQYDLAAKKINDVVDIAENMKEYLDNFTELCGDEFTDKSGSNMSEEWCRLVGLKCLLNGKKGRSSPTKSNEVEGKMNKTKCIMMYCKDVHAESEFFAKYCATCEERCA